MSASAQAEVLTNEDLLPIIFAFMDPEAFLNNIWDLESTTPSNLFSAAITCKAFFNPAITLLWRKLESILPVLKLLSTFVLVDGVYTINDTISSEDHRVLQLYGTKVRYLCLTSFHETIKGHAIHRLATLKCQILPNLQSVYIPSLKLPYHLKNSGNLDVLFLAYSTTMTTLEINGISATAEENIASYLSVLEQKDVPLQDIVLGGCLTTHTFSLLHMFTCLKSLNLILTSATLLSSDFLSWRNLPSLTHLAINMDQYCIYDENTTQPQNSIRVRFEKLQYLQFGGPSVLILKLLQAMDILESLATIRLTCPMSAELVLL
ncbi:hypothetical protein BJ912DRAFT_920776 [Pholiota molesta]|nr:hypothetical protein BJ912DRAFT_920776 [Pholiota molesta]